MSRRNYTNYSKKNENLEPEVVETAPAVELEVDDVIETVVEHIAPAVEVVPEIPKVGTVTGCTKLNVRAKPAATADVVSVINAGTEVEIDETKSTAEWYKVVTASCVEGYCMKKFITVL